MITIHWSHGWGLAAQIIVLWIIVSVIATPLIGRYLRNRRTNDEFRELLSVKHEGRDLTPAEKAAIEKSDSRWTEAPLTEAAFALDEPNQPRRSA
jgi:hypothetical protein